MALRCPMQAYAVAAEKYLVLLGSAASTNARWNKVYQSRSGGTVDKGQDRTGCSSS